MAVSSLLEQFWGATWSLFQVVLPQSLLQCPPEASLSSTKHLDSWDNDRPLLSCRTTSDVSFSGNSYNNSSSHPGAIFCPGDTQVHRDEIHSGVCGNCPAS